VQNGRESTLITAEQILEFWFADSLTGVVDLAPHVARWFRGEPDFDQTIAARFGADIERAGKGWLDGWAVIPRGRLALILLLDQFARNVWRGSPRAYRYDARAVALCREGLASAADRALAPLEREFFYMPLLHSEWLNDQRLALVCLERLLADAPTALLPYFRQSIARARRYRAIIFWFGRFPHRNAILGRQSTFPERVFLAALALRRRAAGPPARLQFRGRD
jgi:uncharacterized protein (DUF924 family)